MEYKDFNFEEIKKRLENYEEAPNPQIWKKIEKQMRPNNLLLKTSIAISTLLLVAFAGVLIFTPTQTPETKQIAKQTKTTKNISMKKENISMKKENISMKKNLETKNTISPITIQTPKEETIEKQDVKIIEEKQEKVEEIKQKTEIKQEKQTTIIEEKIVEQKHSEKVPENNDNITRTQLIIPNAFTPTSGDNNSIFKPAFTELKDYKMNIYSSNGTLVFTSDNIEQGWDGNYKGNPQPMAVYVYFVKFTNLRGENIQQKGELMLIR